MRVRHTYKRSMQIALVVGGICFCVLSSISKTDRQYFRKWKRRIFPVCREVFPHLYVYDVCKWNPPGLLAVFTAIGKATKGAVVSLTRQILFLLPLIIIFPIFIGIDGVMYAGPIADGTAAVVAIVLARSEIKKMS